jgi:hypothetical protein
MVLTTTATSSSERPKPLEPLAPPSVNQSPSRAYAQHMNPVKTTRLVLMKTLLRSRRAARWIGRLVL